MVGVTVWLFGTQLQVVEYYPGTYRHPLAVVVCGEASSVYRVLEFFHIASLEVYADVANVPFVHGLVWQVISKLHVEKHLSGDVYRVGQV